MFRRVAAALALVMALAGCAPAQPDTASTPRPPSSVVLEGVKYAFVAEGTLAEDLVGIPGARAGYTSATSVYVDPEPQNGVHDWYVLNTAFLDPVKSPEPHTIDSQAILLVHSKDGGYRLDAATACKIITDAKASRKARPEQNIRFDKAVFKVRTYGDTCSASMPMRSF